MHASKARAKAWKRLCHSTHRCHVAYLRFNRCSQRAEDNIWPGWDIASVWGPRPLNTSKQRSHPFPSCGRLCYCYGFGAVCRQSPSISGTRSARWAAPEIGHLRQQGSTEIHRSGACRVDGGSAKITAAIKKITNGVYSAALTCTETQREVTT